MEGTTEFLDLLLRHALALTAVTSLAGGIAMAIVDLVKTLLRWRGRYLEWELRRWCSGLPRPKLGVPVWPCAVPAGTRSESFNKLMDLTAGGDRHALTDQPIKDACQKITAAARIVLEYPDQHSDLLPALLHDELTRPRMREYLSRRGAKLDAAAAATSGETGADTSAEEIVALTDADEKELSHRLLLLADRRIDALRQGVEYRWRRIMYLSAVALSTPLLLAGLVAADTSLWYAVLLAPVGGAVAPFTKDVLRALEQFTRRTR